MDEQQQDQHQGSTAPNTSTAPAVATPANPISAEAATSADPSTPAPADSSNPSSGSPSGDDSDGEHSIHDLIDQAEAKLELWEHEAADEVRAILQKIRQEL